MLYCVETFTLELGHGWNLLSSISSGPGPCSTQCGDTITLFKERVEIIYFPLYKGGLQN